ncbi:hypothetical protein TanjilG_30485 [Lupinus angustifolius]|uniref:CAX-interacting protein 4-like n=1 Tax=Lupinus angustifolius TaxID=3871 RepID=UPI00090D6FD8|nr:PREDICTED: CAX-interacting protein 4-like [Lupinus angustifolius]XP_019427797.1 PREDICTED: CAX-interacting protein 4-like [Lupinus angustifolius]OIV91263.1 hypothetical protein TanjilG_30485 [Lupinus angustifolius]
MPATAGRVRMPANNRVHSSAALQTHGIWQSAIGYDPYAPNKEDKKDTSQNLPNDEPDAENAYASFQGLLQLAKITNADVDISRGACKRCGRVGHLKFQCKNYVKIKDETEEKNLDMSMGLVGLDKKLRGDKRSNIESSEEEDSESSDSEVDSEIERIIAQRSGKKISGRGGSSRKKGGLDDDDGSDKDSGKKRKKRGRSKKRSGKREVSDSDDSSERRRSRRSKRRREHRRKRDESSDEDDEHRRRRRKSRKEKRRRRSRPSDSDSESSEDSGIRRKQKSKRVSSSSDSDSSGYNDLRRMGRDVKKSEKRRCHRRDDE